MDYLVSHRARLVNGEVVLQRVPNAYNDTPFWVVKVPASISSGHSDTNSDEMRDLLNQIARLSRVYETDVQTLMVTGSLRAQQTDRDSPPGDEE